MKKELSIVRSCLSQASQTEKRKFSWALIFLGLASPLLVLAVDIPDPLNVSTFGQLIDNIINVIWNLALVVAPLMIIIAGFFFITAVGDPEKIQTAKNIILYTVIGFLIIILAKGFVHLLRTTFQN